MQITMWRNHTQFTVMVVSKKRKEKDYSLSEKPSNIPGCPGGSEQHTQNNSTNIKCCTLSAHAHIHTYHTCIGGSQAVNSSDSTTSSTRVHLTRPIRVVQQNCTNSIQQLHHKQLRQRQGYNDVTTLMTSWMWPFKTLIWIFLNHSVYPSPLSGWW